MSSRWDVLKPCFPSDDVSSRSTTSATPSHCSNTTTKATAIDNKWKGRRRENIAQGSTNNTWGTNTRIQNEIKFRQPSNDTPPAYTNLEKKKDYCQRHCNNKSNNSKVAISHEGNKRKTDCFLQSIEQLNNLLSFLYHHNNIDKVKQDDEQNDMAAVKSDDDDDSDNITSSSNHYNSASKTMPETATANHLSSSSPSSSSTSTHSAVIKELQLEVNNIRTILLLNKQNVDDDCCNSIPKSYNNTKAYHDLAFIPPSYRIKAIAILTYTLPIFFLKKETLFFHNCDNDSDGNDIPSVSTISTGKITTCLLYCPSQCQQTSSSSLLSYFHTTEIIIVLLSSLIVERERGNNCYSHDVAVTGGGGRRGGGAICGTTPWKRHQVEKKRDTTILAKNALSATSLPIHFEEQSLLSSIIPGRNLIDKNEMEQKVAIIVTKCYSKILNVITCFHFPRENKSPQQHQQKQQQQPTDKNTDYNGGNKKDNFFIADCTIGYNQHKVQSDDNDRHSHYFNKHIILVHELLSTSLYCVYYWLRYCISLPSLSSENNNNNNKIDTCNEIYKVVESIIQHVLLPTIELSTLMLHNQGLPQEQQQPTTTSITYTNNGAVTRGNILLTRTVVHCSCISLELIIYLHSFRRHHHFYYATRLQSYSMSTNKQILQVLRDAMLVQPSALLSPKATRIDPNVEQIDLCHGNTTSTFDRCLLASRYFMNTCMALTAIINVMGDLMKGKSTAGLSEKKASLDGMNVDSYILDLDVSRLLRRIHILLQIQGDDNDINTGLDSTNSSSHLPLMDWSQIMSDQLFPCGINVSGERCDNDESMSALWPAALSLLESLTIFFPRIVCTHWDYFLPESNHIASWYTTPSESDILSILSSTRQRGPPPLLAIMTRDIPPLVQQNLRKDKEQKSSVALQSIKINKIIQNKVLASQAVEALIRAMPLNVWLGITPKRLSHSLAGSRHIGTRVSAALEMTVRGIEHELQLRTVEDSEAKFLDSSSFFRQLCSMATTLLTHIPFIRDDDVLCQSAVDLIETISRTFVHPEQQSGDKRVMISLANGTAVSRTASLTLKTIMGGKIRQDGNITPMVKPMRQWLKNESSSSAQFLQKVNVLACTRNFIALEHNSSPNQNDDALGKGTCLECLDIIVHLVRMAPWACDWSIVNQGDDNMKQPHIISTLTVVDAALSCKNKTILLLGLKIINSLLLGRHDCTQEDEEMKTVMDFSFVSNFLCSRLHTAMSYADSEVRTAAFSAVGLLSSSDWHALCQNRYDCSSSSRGEIAIDIVRDVVSACSMTLCGQPSCQVENVTSVRAEACKALGGICTAVIGYGPEDDANEIQKLSLQLSDTLLSFVSQQSGEVLLLARRDASAGVRSMVRFWLWQR